jgi:hypothetical protein
MTLQCFGFLLTFRGNLLHPSSNLKMEAAFPPKRRLPIRSTLCCNTEEKNPYDFRSEYNFTWSRHVTSYLQKLRGALMVCIKPSDLLHLHGRRVFVVTDFKTLTRWDQSCRIMSHKTAPGLVWIGHRKPVNMCVFLYYLYTYIFCVVFMYLSSLSCSYFVVLCYFDDL